MQTHRLHSFVAVLTLAGGLQPPPGCGPLPPLDPGEPSAPAPAPHVAMVTTAEIRDSTQVPPPQDEFPLFEVRDVLVYAQYSELDDGVYVQRAAFYTPDGGLYASIARAFAIGPDAPATIEAGGVGPLPVEPASGPADAPFVLTALAVSGTPIMLNVVAGTWRVVVTLDGQAEPAGETSFELVK
ncbi:MAG: hypothetical protein HY906_08045 [Deltaproteobacteria bacterium]|nr:hypothetical protein [Deltaproteobacteria bacterium]